MISTAKLASTCRMRRYHLSRTALSHMFSLHYNELFLLPYSVCYVMFGLGFLNVLSKKLKDVIWHSS